MDSTSRRQIFSTFSAGTALAALGVAASSSATAASTQTVTQSLTTLVSGGASQDPSQPVQVANAKQFIGTFTLKGVTSVVSGGLPTVLNAVGTLAGDLLDSAGHVVGTVAPQSAVTAPLQVAGSCQILTLTLGPLHLNLLGLVIDLNQINLNITAVPGAGNLLGNLLCDIANLLNANGPLANLLSGLQTLLNQLIGALGTL